MSDIDATDDQLRIFNILKLNPDTLYVTPDGNNIYILSQQDNVEGLLRFERLEGPLWNTLSGEDLNVIVQDFLKDLVE